MKELILATGNTHKAEEFALLLQGIGFNIVSASKCGGMPPVVEDGETFAANAQIKAEALRAIAPTDAWVLADDSGLEVDALDGAPGIFSARYAGSGASDQENLQKLLSSMKQVKNRSARFRCVLCLIDPEGYLTHYEGISIGTISANPSGTKGFGYDPVFIPEGYNKSFSELGETVKNKISHRAKAVDWLRTVLGEIDAVSH